MNYNENSFKHIRSVDDAAAAVHRAKKNIRRLQPQDIVCLYF